MIKIHYKDVIIETDTSEEAVSVLNVLAKIGGAQQSALDSWRDRLCPKCRHVKNGPACRRDCAKIELTAQEQDTQIANPKV